MTDRTMPDTNASYAQRRNEIQHYFDRTAIEGWKKLTSDAPVSRIRETVRKGRDQMRATMISFLPDDLTGWRILDAGCGAGPMSVALANRGADVLGIDLSPEMIRHASAGLPEITGGGSVTLRAGDMLSPQHGEFDAVMAMDSVIHYQPKDAASAIADLAGRTRRKIIFTFAPRTPLLAAMHLSGKLFPRGDRAPAIEPVTQKRLTFELAKKPAMLDWAQGNTHRVSSSFYISQALELSRK